MATLKHWYPLTQDNSNYAGEGELTLIQNVGNITTDYGPLGKCRVTTVKDSTTYLKGGPVDVQGSHAMFCFLKVTELSRTNSANGVLGSHNASTQRGTGITLKAISDTVFRASVNTGHVTSRTYFTHYGETDLHLNKWYHLGFSYDDDTRILRIYVDGKVDFETTVDKIYMNPDDIFAAFVWSISNLGTANYRPAMMMQDVRVYKGVPSVAEIQSVKRGCFFHLPMNAPIKGSVLEVDSWEIHDPRGDILEQNNSYIKLRMDSDGLLAIRPHPSAVIGDRYRISGYLYKNDEPVNVTQVSSANLNSITFGDPKTGFFVEDFTENYSWVIHASGGLGNPVIGDIYEFKDLTYEQLTVQQSTKDILSDESGMGNNIATSKDLPMFDPVGSVTGSGCFYFDDHLLLSESNIVRDGEGISACVWVKGTETGYDDFHRILNVDATELEIALMHSRYPRYSITVNGVRSLLSISTGDVNVLDGNWHHLALTYDGSTLKGYIDGDPYASRVINEPLTKLNGQVRIGQSNNTVTGLYGSKELRKSDAYIFGTALDEYEIRDVMYRRFSFNKEGEFTAKGFSEMGEVTSLSKAGVLNASNLIETNYEPSLIDYSTWKLGFDRYDGFTRYGDSNRSEIVIDDAPHGFDDVVWRAINDDQPVSSKDGGFNAVRVAIDARARYRYSVWIRRKVTGDGNHYFGARAFNPGSQHATENFSGVIQPNSYSVQGRDPGNEWQLYVAYMYPAGTSPEPVDDGGVYDLSGERVREAISFRFAGDATMLEMRCYLAFSSDQTTRQDHFRPRIEKIDGTEPSIEQLVKCIEHTPLVGDYVDGEYRPSTYTLGDDMVSEHFVEI